MTEPAVGLVLVVCTDKKRHPWTQLGVLHRGDDQGDGFLISSEPRNSKLAPRADRRKEECVWIDEMHRAHLWCPRCKRHIQWRHATAVDVMKRLWETYPPPAVPVLDVSAVP